MTDAFRKERCLEALKEAGFSYVRAAKALGITRKNLWEILGPKRDVIRELANERKTGT